MADGENVYLVVDDFVHDAVGFDDQSSFGNPRCCVFSQGCKNIA